MGKQAIQVCSKYFCWRPLIMVISLPFFVESSWQLFTRLAKGRCLVVSNAAAQFWSFNRWVYYCCSSGELFQSPFFHLVECCSERLFWIAYALDHRWSFFSTLYLWKGFTSFPWAVSRVSTLQGRAFVMLTQRSSVLRPCLVVCHFDVGQHFLSFLLPVSHGSSIFAFSTLHNAQSSSFI